MGKMSYLRILFPAQSTTRKLYTIEVSLCNNNSTTSYDYILCNILFYYQRVITVFRNNFAETESYPVNGCYICILQFVVHVVNIYFCNNMSPVCFEMT